MNILKGIGRRVDALVEMTRRLIARSRQSGEHPPLDPDEGLGECLYCQTLVTRADGVRFPDGAAHKSCQETVNADRERTLAAYQAYNHGDAFKRLRELGDGQISAIVLDVNQKIAKPASARTLLSALDEIEERIYTDTQVASETRLAARSAIAQARKDLRGEALTLN